MAFLGLDTQLGSLTIQKTQLEYKEMILSNQYNEITQELSNYLDGSGTEDAKSRSLEAQQELYDQEKGSIESQVKAITAEIDGYQKAVDANIKSECKLSISV